MPIDWGYRGWADPPQGNITIVCIENREGIANSNNATTHDWTIDILIGTWYNDTCAIHVNPCSQLVTHHETINMESIFNLSVLF